MNIIFFITILQTNKIFAGLPVWQNIQITYNILKYFLTIKLIEELKNEYVLWEFEIYFLEARM